MVKDNRSRQVTFSKRRSKIFKKANECVSLCTVQITIAIFSPGGKAASFGHPNPEMMAGHPNHKMMAGKFLKDDSQRETRIEQLGQWINELNPKELLVIKKKVEKLQERVRERISETEAARSLLLLSNSPPKDDA